MIPVIYTSRHKCHSTDVVHIRIARFISDEVPQRAEIILEALISSGRASIVSPKDWGIEPILAVHHPDMVAFLQDGAEAAAHQPQFGGVLLPEVYPVLPTRRISQNPVSKMGQFCHGTDSPILPGAWDASYWSAQCALTGADYLRQGYPTIYSRCRPPGHHAANRAFGGFCYLNNAAIAARFLLETNSKIRVGILDIDYHHSNGTQEIFYSDPEVYYCSLHADPESDYPYYWGGSEETGDGQGNGYNCNCQFRAGYCSG